MFALIFSVLYIAVQIYEYIFMAYIILGFFPIDENNFFVKMIRSVCEPLYRNLLRFLPPLRFGMMDFSPIYVFVFLYIVEYILRRLAQMF
jgi:YggT family protein